MMGIATAMASPELVATLRARFRGVVRILTAGPRAGDDAPGGACLLTLESPLIPEDSSTVDVTVEGGRLRVWPSHWS